MSSDPSERPDAYGGAGDRPRFAPPVAPESRVQPPADPRSGDVAASEPAAAPAQAAAGTGTWPWWTAFAALATGWLGGNVLASIVIVAADPNRPAGADLPIGLQVVAQLLLSAALVGSALFFARLGGRVTPEKFGLRSTHVGWALLWVVAGFLTFTLVGGAWLQLVDAQEEQDAITEMLSDDPATATVIGLAFVTVVVAPIVEELFFRGFVFTALRSRIGVGLAAVVSGTLFGVVHVFGSPWQFLLPLALLGTVLALIFWRTRSLYPCIALHAFNNCLAFGTARDWDWQILALLAASFAVISIILLIAVRIGDRRPQPA